MPFGAVLPEIAISSGIVSRPEKEIVESTGTVSDDKQEIVIDGYKYTKNK